jgi:hypothetical protein
VGKTDGTDKASRELTSRAPYQSAAQNLYLADILPQKTRIYTSIRFQRANCQWTVPAMHVWPGAKMDVSAGSAAAT